MLSPKKCVAALLSVAIASLAVERAAACDGSIVVAPSLATTAIVSPLVVTPTSAVLASTVVTLAPSACPSTPTQVQVLAAPVVAHGLVVERAAARRIASRQVVVQRTVVRQGVAPAAQPLRALLRGVLR